MPAAPRSKGPHDSAGVRGASLARNSVINLAGQLLPAILAIAATPYLIRALGVERFGLLSLAWVVLGYLSMFDLGLGRATIKKLSEAIGRAEEHRVGPLFWTALALQTALGVLGTIVVVLWGSAIVSGLNASPAVIAEARGAVRVFEWSIVAVLLFNFSRAPLEATQRFDLVNLVRIPVNSANVLVPVLGAMAGRSLPAILTWLVLIRVVGSLAQIVFCFRVLPSLRSSVSVTAAAARELLSFGGWITISSIVSPVLVYADRFLVGLLVTVAAAGHYSVPAELASRLLIVPAGIVATLFPEFSSIAGRGDRRALASLFANTLRYLLFICGPAAILIIAFAGDLLAVWVGPDFALVAHLPLRILVAAVLLNALAYVPYSAIQASGRPDVTAKLHLMELPVQLVLTVAFVRTWGVTGAAAAWAIRVSADALLLFIIAPRLFGSRLDLYPWTAFKRFLALSLALIASLVIIRVLPLPLWGLLAGALSLYFGAMIVVWFTLMDDAERKTALGIVRFRRVLSR